MVDPRIRIGTAQKVTLTLGDKEYNLTKFNHPENATTMEYHCRLAGTCIVMGLGRFFIWGDGSMRHPACRQVQGRVKSQEDEKDQHPFTKECSLNCFKDPKNKPSKHMSDYTFKIE